MAVIVLFIGKINCIKFIKSLGTGWIFNLLPRFISPFNLLKVHSAATSLAADLLKYHTDHMVLKALKITGVEGNLEAVAEYACKLSEQKEQLVEVSSQMLSFCETLRKWVARFDLPSILLHFTLFVVGCEPEVSLWHIVVAEGMYDHTWFFWI